MKGKRFTILQLSACLAMFALASCSNETDLLVEETSETTTVEENPQIKITINQSSGGSVIYTRASDEELQTSDEKEIKSLNTYIFYKGDSDYLYYGTYAFSSDSITDNTYYISMDNDLIGKTVQVILIANDTPSVTLTKGSTTLTSFQSSLASASISTGDYVDKLVGSVTSLDTSNNPVTTFTTGYPMSATATDSNNNSTVTLTISGVDLNATLIRTMARIDIKNYVTNLTVTDVYVYNTPNESYLLAANSPAEPTSSYVTLKPLYRYFNDLLEFTPSDNTADVESVKTTSSEDSSTVTYYTWMKHVLYMYEQSVSSSSYPSIFISYTITDTNSSNTYNGTIEVPFYSSSDNYSYNVYRNCLYTIRLGKSSTSSSSDDDDDDDDDDDPTSNDQTVTINFDAECSATISVADWYSGETITTTLNTSSDTQVDNTSDSES